MMNDAVLCNNKMRKGKKGQPTHTNVASFHKIGWLFVHTKHEHFIGLGHF